ncbi:MAG: hypothetical protein BKP49_05510 [Treponema sp. CETP13]|nr:MAG: hypothetical protein BKP49_05510 [Treponema sp. CETP13]
MYQMIRLNICFILVFFIINHFCFANTVLETLWAKADLNSPDLKIAKIDIQKAEFKLKQKNNAYEPTVSSSINSSFNSLYDPLTWYPVSAVNRIVFSKPFPGSFVLSTSLNYAIDRNFLNFFEGGTPENVGYSQTPSFSINISQGICPYWLQNYPKNPYEARLEYSVQENIQNCNQTKKSIIFSITDS